MDSKTKESLRAMLCEEIEAIAKKGNLTRESLDILKDLIETEKNIGKIEHYDDEKKMKEGLVPYDGGYSQRKYYIDADYQPMGMSYAPMGNSYARGGRMTYDVDRNSYMYMEPQYPMADGNSMAMRGMSRTGSKEEMVKELDEMMNEATDSKVKEAIQKAITEVNK
jgi:hypothetical protein